MESKQLALLAAMIILGAALLKWYTDFDSMGLDGNGVTSGDAPSTQLFQVEQTTFNTDGNRHYRIEAEKAVHFALREEAEFTHPLIYFYEDNQASWAASALAGIATDNGERVYLRGEVTVQQRDQGENPLSLITPEIILHPRSQFAETEQKVTIRQANFITQATGMQVDMTSGTVLLQSKVTSRYEPKPLPK
jgi:lipopolysaccharide export system protein LptC